MGFPVFYAGIRPLDSKGRAIVQAYDVPVRCGEVIVYPGDIIYADFDGIVVVPRALEQDLFIMAQDKVKSENLSRQELINGKSLREVYNKYKAL